MTTPEHLPDDIAAARKAADDLLDALHYIRCQYRPGATPILLHDAIDKAYAAWMIVHVDLPRLVQS